MENENVEVIATQNDDTVVEKTTAPEVDVAKLQETNKQLFERAKKAEAEAREYKAKANSAPVQSPQPNDVDRLDRLELSANDIKHPDDQKLVLDEAKRLKLPVSELASMEYMQSKLKATRDARDARDGLPSGTKRGDGVGRNDVEYYMANPDKRPSDQATAEKVLSAKMAQEKSSNQFSDVMY